MRAVLAVVLVAACYGPSPTAGAPCGPGNACPAGLECVEQLCQPPGTPSSDAFGAPPDSCTAVTCNGDVLEGCGQMRQCTDGCVATGVPHCARITPSNGIDWALVPFPNAATLVLASGPSTFDTTTGELADASGPVALDDVASVTVGNLRVLALGGLVLEAGAELSITGALPLVILVDGDATIAAGAAISLVPGTAGGGAGGIDLANPATGCGLGDSGTANDSATEVGGGGGGFGRSGGDSPGSGPAPRAAGGLACGNEALEPLVGGSGGGAGGIDGAIGTAIGGRGGDGGGALQLTVSGTLTVDGALDANGAGGENGHRDTTLAEFGGGGGGGSGGALLLEARMLAGTGTITANGGGGGGNDNTPNAGNGQSGRRSRQCAQGGSAEVGHGGGGDGGCAAKPNADDASATGDRGGGGGAIGRIRINARATMVNAIISPNETRAVPALE